MTYQTDLEVVVGCWSVEKENILSCWCKASLRKWFYQLSYVWPIRWSIYKYKSKCCKPRIIFLAIKKALTLVVMKFFSRSKHIMVFVEKFSVGLRTVLLIDVNVSTFLIVWSGVPSIYINGINHAYNLSKPYFFADDGALFFENSCKNHSSTWK